MIRILTITAVLFLQLLSAASANTSREAYQIATPDNIQAVEQALDDNLRIAPEDFFDGPAADDLSYQMLYQLFGTPVQSVRDAFFGGSGFNSAAIDQYQGGTTLLTNLAKIMIAVSMIVGMILLTYIIIIGLLKTSQTGQFLGNWDSVMLPMRATLGFGLNLPMPAFGGLNVAQVATLGVALLGIGMGGAVYKYVLNSYTSTPITMTQGGSNTEDLVGKLILSKVCERFLVKSGLADEAGGAYEQFSMPGSANKYLLVGLDGACGQMAVAGDIGSAQQSSINSVGAKNVITAADIAKIKIQRDIGNKVISTLSGSAIRSIADDIVSGNITEATHRARRDAILGLTADIQSAVTAGLPAWSNEQRREGLEKLNRLGWVGFGSIYWTLNAEQNKIHDAVVSAIPKITTPGEGVSGYEAGWLSNDAVMTEFTAVMARADKFNKIAATMADAMSQLQTRNDSESVLGRIANVWNSITNGATRITYNLGSGALKTGTYGLSPGASAGNYDPMLELRTMGNTILTIGTGLVAADFVSKFMGDDEGSDKVRGKGGAAISWATGLVATFSMMLLAIGVLLAYGIPLMPYILWTIAMVGYLTYVAQSVVVAPLWSIMHMTPDGGDVTGKGGSGYPILMNLALRPVLMVTGMVMGIAIFRVSGWLVNETLLETLISTREGSFGLPLTPIVGMVVYTLLMVVVAYMSFSLSYELPRAALRWVGVDDTMDLGEREGQSQTLAFFATSGRNLGGFKAAGK
ncbi:DotA/TraY family protein [Alcanivorax sp. 1008]|uniref:DotA/TraY family protein n=1 Tax=Alcanivorax sp. 1008 TaxID=2816853 RepID=UPI001E2E3764|nr:DotA/TraY family protein [Alcanivorax sp. 1008]